MLLPLRSRHVFPSVTLYKRYTCSPPHQPQPDPALLTTEPPSADNIADDAAKINLVSPDFKKNPATKTSVQDIPSEAPGEAPSRRRRYIDEIEEEGFYLWNLAKQYVLHPAVAGGLIGLGEFPNDLWRVPCSRWSSTVNVGLITGTAYTFYTKPHLQRDTRAIFSAVGGALALLGVEGYAAEKYHETPHGQREARKAKEEGAVLYRAACEHLLRPGVLGGLLGVCERHRPELLGAVHSCRL